MKNMSIELNQGVIDTLGVKDAVVYGLMINYAANRLAMTGHLCFRAPWALLQYNGFPGTSGSHYLKRLSDEDFIYRLQFPVKSQPIWVYSFSGSALMDLKKELERKGELK